MSDRPSRFWQVLLMLPFFIIGVAIPVNIYGFSGEGPPNLQTAPYSPVTPAFTPPVSSPSYADYPRVSYPLGDPDRQAGIVRVFREFYDAFVDRFVSASRTPVAIKLFVFIGFLLTAVTLMRVLLIWGYGALSWFPMMIAHLAAAPLMVGFLAVGSCWGLYDTLAQYWVSNAAAPVVTLTAAIASLFLLANIKPQLQIETALTVPVASPMGRSYI